MGDVVESMLLLYSEVLYTAIKLYLAQIPINVLELNEESEEDAICDRDDNRPRYGLGLLV